MFHYTLKGHDGLEWRTLSKPINAAEAVRQFEALITNNVPALLTAVGSHELSKQERSMAFLHQVIEHPSVEARVTEEEVTETA